MIDSNYFELFDIPVNLKIDAGQLKRIFFTKSREFHPDYFTQASADEQDYALAMTSLLNQAYATLGDPKKRLAYFLVENKIDIKGNAQALPQMFLFEMMDLNETIEGCKTTEEFEKVSKTITELEQSFEAEVKPLLEADDLRIIPDEDLEALKLYHLKSKYLVRLRETLERTNQTND
jgi:molecular chaperone HscB